MDGSLWWRAVHVNQQPKIFDWRGTARVSALNVNFRLPVFSLQNRGPVEPSQQFIRTYFSTFRNDPVVAAIYDKSVSVHHVMPTSEISTSGETRNPSYFGPTSETALPQMLGVNAQKEHQIPRQQLWQPMFTVTCLLPLQTQNLTPTARFSVCIFIKKKKRCATETIAAVVNPAVLLQLWTEITSCWLGVLRPCLFFTQWTTNIEEMVCVIAVRQIRVPGEGPWRISGEREARPLPRKVG